MGRKPKCTHRKLMRAIENSSGIISVIAKRLNVSWVVANNSIKRDSEAYQFYLDECEKIIDVAESVVISSIRDNKDVNTAKWYLEKKGAVRGYNPAFKVEAEQKSVTRVYIDDLGKTDNEAGNG